MDKFINTLDIYIKLEILQYIYPHHKDMFKIMNIKNIYFKEFNYKYEYAYIADDNENSYFDEDSVSSKYPKFLLKNLELLNNKNNVYISRIPKKNGKYRYYITKKYENLHCDCNIPNHYCANYYHDHGCNEVRDITYKSIYVGNKLDNALFRLILDDITS
jgi:hypothetical protein